MMPLLVTDELRSSGEEFAYRIKTAHLVTPGPQFKRHLGLSLSDMGTQGN